jgi:hypothetical protein
MFDVETGETYFLKKQNMVFHRFHSFTHQVQISGVSIVGNGQSQAAKLPD